MNQQRANLINNNFRNSASILDNGSVQQTNITNTPLTAVQPPIPSRRQTNLYQPYSDYRPYGTYFGNSYGSNWNYGGRYNGYGYNPYSGYSPFSQNQWSNPSGDAENRFVQYAEESTRPAFQSIEAMVHTFSSMTMMLESTFFAMTSSFRAILGVAENMGKLRSMLSQFIQTFTLFRFFKWIYWKVKYILGSRGQDMNNEILWRQTITEVLQGNGENRPSSWPIFLFLTLIFATPYLMHRLFKNAKSINFNNPKEWMQCKEPVFTATALYDFNGATPEELSLKTGQKIWLAPKSLQPKNIQGWWRATDSINVGLIPSSYVTIVGQLKKKTEVSHTNVASNIEGQDDLRENYQSEENKKYEMDEIFQLTKDSN